MSGEIMSEKFSVEALMERTKALPTLSHLVGGTYNGVIQYETERGTSFGIPLRREAALAVQIVFMCAGTLVAEHVHDETEWLLVYQGRLRLHLGNETEEYGVAEGRSIEPSLPHQSEALEDTWMLCATIPAAEGYPNNGRERSPAG